MSVQPRPRSAKSVPTVRRVFITGGASGLGQALAKCYAAQGWRVCIGDLDVERCADTVAAVRAAGAEVQALRCDVTNEADLASAADWIQQHWGGLDLLINNAGVAQVGRIDDVSIEDWNWIISINLLGVVRGCKAFVPMLRAQGSGHIVNVSSMAGLIHMPSMSAYNATKAAVVALSETLLAELYDDGIGVSVVCPEFFRTNLATGQRASTPALAQLTHKLVERSKYSADWVAGLVVAGVEAGDFHILTHTDAKIAWAAKRALPFTAYFKLLRRQFKRFAR